MVIGNIVFTVIVLIAIAVIVFGTVYTYGCISGGVRHPDSWLA